MSDEIDNPTQDLDTRPMFDRLLAEMIETREVLAARLDVIDSRLSVIEETLSLLVEDVVAVRARQRTLERRISAPE